jgi:hypothetical protein
MLYDDLEELHNIQHIANLPSLLTLGILSNDRSKSLGKHESVALEVIQDRREKVIVPNTNRRLHSYANVYFNARNKMMSRLRGQHRDLCVLRLNKKIFLCNGVVVADQNASSDYVRFGGGVNGLKLIDQNMVYARSWKHPEDQRLEWRHGSVVCAEVLVPDRVLPEDIMGVYVSCNEAASQVCQNFPTLHVTVNADMFFR